MRHPLPATARPAVRSSPAVSAGLIRTEDFHVGRFTAMGGPCEVRLDSEDPALAATVLEIVGQETRRIERAFSRHRAGNIIHRIHHAGGRPVAVDPETALLLDYAAACYELSEGLFDITSGALLRVWKFDGSERVPAESAVRELLEYVGWHRVTWVDPVLTVPSGMELDLGAVWKEYAVDRAASLVAVHTTDAFLVDIGGDLYASGPRRGGRPWGVTVDDPARSGAAALPRIELPRGGLATSGDARHFLTWKGRRLGHILDPRTGWPVEGAPRSITVRAPTCLEAGTLSTLACLQGGRAREFLEEQDVQFRLV